MCSLLIVFFSFSHDGKGLLPVVILFIFPPDKKGRPSHSSHFDATSPLIVSLFVYYVVTNVVIYY